jgi:hypothetical protein
MVTTRLWWRVLVGGEAWWWCSIVLEFFCGQELGEIPVGLSEPDAVPLLVAPFLLEGHLGKPWSTLL